MCRYRRGVLFQTDKTLKTKTTSQCWCVCVCACKLMDRWEGGSQESGFDLQDYELP